MSHIISNCLIQELKIKILEDGPIGQPGVTGLPGVYQDQGTVSVAIGYNTGQFSQGTGYVAIGQNAGQTQQKANTNVIGSFVAEYTTYFSNIRSITSITDWKKLIYNPDTKEFSYEN